MVSDDPQDLSLDEQVAYHVNATAELKRQRNCQRSPIYQLPPEILSLIFLIYSKLHEPHVEYGASTYRWIWIMHVSHHWREVALKTAQLWTNIDVGPSQKAQEHIRASIERSNGAPLTIVYKNPSVTSLSFLGTLVPEIARTESFTLSMPTRELLKSPALSSFPHLAPILRRLEIEDTSPWGQLTEHPVFFKECTTPILQDLTVRYIQVDWSPGAMPCSLTKLHIDNSHAATKVLVEDVVAGLTPLNNLECLDLIQALSPIPLQDASLQIPLNKVELPHLKQLTISNSTSSCARLLAALEYQAVHVKLTLDLTGEHDTQPIAALARTLAYRVEQLSPDMLVLHVPPACISGTLELGKRSGALDEPPSEGATLQSDNARPFIRITQAAVHFMHAGVDESIPHVLEHFVYFLARMPLVTVTTCSIRTILSAPATAFQLFAATPNISTLVVHEGSSSLQSVRLDDVRGVLNCTAGSDPPVYYLPQLQHLVLHNVEFEDAGDPENVASFTSMLTKRRDAGLEIRRISIRRCINMDESEVERLQVYMQEVDWDHVVVLEDPEMSDGHDDDHGVWRAEEDVDLYEHDDVYDDGYRGDPYGREFEHWLQHLDQDEYEDFIAD